MSPGSYWCEAVSPAPWVPYAGGRGDRGPLCRATRRARSKPLCARRRRLRERHRRPGQGGCTPTTVAVVRGKLRASDRRDSGLRVRYLQLRRQIRPALPVPSTAARRLSSDFRNPRSYSVLQLQSPGPKRGISRKPRRSQERATARITAAAELTMKHRMLPRSVNRLHRLHTYGLAERQGRRWRTRGPDRRDDLTV